MAALFQIVHSGHGSTTGTGGASLEPAVAVHLEVAEGGEGVVVVCLESLEGNAHIEKSSLPGQVQTVASRPV